MPVDLIAEALTIILISWNENICLFTFEKLFLSTPVENCSNTLIISKLSCE